MGVQTVLLSSTNFFCSVKSERTTCLKQNLWHFYHIGWIILCIKSVKNWRCVAFLICGVIKKGIMFLVPKILVFMERLMYFFPWIISAEMYARSGHNWLQPCIIKLIYFSRLTRIDLALIKLMELGGRIEEALTFLNMNNTNLFSLDAWMHYKILLKNKRIQVNQDGNLFWTEL